MGGRNFHVSLKHPFDHLIAWSLIDRQAEFRISLDCLIDRVIQGLLSHLGRAWRIAVSDSVNHPAHYNQHPANIECIDVVEHFSFNIGNAMKYLWRAGLKGAAQEDLEKAKWYIEREIERNRPKSIRDLIPQLSPGPGTIATVGPNPFPEPVTSVPIGSHPIKRNRPKRNKVEKKINSIPTPTADVKPSVSDRCLPCVEDRHMECKGDCSCWC